MKILWLAPNFNHYKARFLNHLAQENDVDLTILSGTGRSQMGDQEIEANWSFENIKLNVLKKDFGKSKAVRSQLKLLFPNFDWILIPAEKKNLPLFLYAMKLRKHYLSTYLFSYNHAQLKSKNGLYGFLDFKLSKFFNNNLDRVIYYTQEASKVAVRNNLVHTNKAYWANNTIDNEEVNKFYTFELPQKNDVSLLFIGRLIPSKRIADLINYYKLIKQKLPHLKLEIIGDGPDNYMVQDVIDKDLDIIWHGTLVDEEDIAPIMKRASAVFVPGLSGLSINHAFAYGRPYITLEADKHGPEISYLEHGVNGLILKDNVEENINVLTSILKDREKLIEFCENAKTKGTMLSVQNWVNQIKSSLLHES
jgi:glycosyltransferase involved in cell wall biosynthesis